MTANKTKIEQLIKTARGQLDGILTMIDEGRYCIDISTQLMSVGAVIKKANKEIISAHLMNCVKNSSEDNSLEVKLTEIETLIGKIL